MTLVTIKKPGGWPGLVLLSVTIIAGWMELLCHANLLDWRGDS